MTARKPLTQNAKPRRRRAAPNRHGWTPERRAAQAALLRRLKPWQKSTGPRTAAGKAAVRHNALKSGLRSAAHRDLCRALRWQRAFTRMALAAHQLPGGGNLIDRQAAAAGTADLLIACARYIYPDEPPSAALRLMLADARLSG